jgi:hypothetical protein
MTTAAQMRPALPAATLEVRLNRLRAALAAHRALFANGLPVDPTKCWDVNEEIGAARQALYQDIDDLWKSNDALLALYQVTQG